MLGDEDVKIDEECINHNVCKIAEEESAWIIETTFDEMDKIEALMSLAKIRGACMLANRLKEVLE